MNIHIYPKEELLAAWNRDKEHFQPDAVTPPRCLRCGQPLDRHFPVNALSPLWMCISAKLAAQRRALAIGQAKPSLCGCGTLLPTAGCSRLKKVIVIL